MTIFHMGNGWRDLSDEGPIDHLDEKYDGNVEWTVSRNYGEKLYKVKRDGVEIKKFKTDELARTFVDESILREMQARGEILV